MSKLSRRTFFVFPFLLIFLMGCGLLGNLSLGAEGATATPEPLTVSSGEVVPISGQPEQVAPIVPPVDSS